MQLPNQIKTPMPPLPRVVKFPQPPEVPSIQIQPQIDVNSVADIIMGRVSDILKLAKGELNFSDYLLNPYKRLGSYVKDTWVSPLANKEFVNFFIHRLQDLGETVDLVDNLYKGMHLERKYGTGSRLDGLRYAIHDRVNYNFSDYYPNRQLYSFFRELATPTNIILAVASLGAKPLAKEALVKTPVKLSERLVKELTHNYTGDMAKFIAKTQKTMQLTPDELLSLKQLSKHTQSLKILSSLNQTRAVVRAVDTFGPQLAFKTITLPSKFMFKLGTSAGFGVYKYVSKAIDDVIKPTEFVSQVILKQNQSEVITQHMVQALELSGLLDKEVKIDITAGILERAAKNDLKELTQLRKSLVSRSGYNHLLKVLRNIGKQDRALVSVEDLSFADAFKKEIRKKYIASLDTFAYKVSNRKFRNFLDYEKMINLLSDTATPKSNLAILQELVEQHSILYRRFLIQESVEKLQKFDTTLFNVDLRKLIINTENFHKKLEPLMEELNNLKNKRSKILRQFRYLKKKLELIDPNAQPSDYALCKNLFDSLQTRYQIELQGTSRYTSKVFNQEVALKQLELRTISTQFLAQISELTNNVDLKNIPAINETLLAISNLPLTTKGHAELLELNKKLIKSTADIFKEVANKHIANIDELLNALKNLKFESYDPMYKVIQFYIEELEQVKLVLAPLQNLAERLSETKQIKKIFKKIYDTLPQIYETLSRTDLVYFDIMDPTPTHIKMKKVLKKIQEHQKIIERIKVPANKEHEIYKNIFTNRFTKNGQIDHEQLSQLHAKIASTKTDLKHTAIGWALSEGVTFSISDLRFKNISFIPTWEMIEEKYRNIDLIIETKLHTGQHIGLKELNEELMELIYLIDYAHSNITKIVDINKYISDSPIEKLPLIDVLGKLEKIAHTLEIPLNKINLTDAAAKNMRKYVLMSNSAYRNLYLLSYSEELNKLLDYIELGAILEHKDLVTFEAIASIPIANFIKFSEYVAAGDLKQALKIYEQISPIRAKQLLKDSSDLMDALNSVKVELDEFIMCHQQATTILRTLHDMTAFRRFITKLEDAVEVGRISEDIKNRLFDSMLAYDEVPFYDVDDALFNKIINKVDDSLRSASGPYSLQLEKIFNHAVDNNKIPAEEIEQFRKLFPSHMTHTAIADAYMSSLLDKYLTDVYDEIGLKDVLIHIDLEATGINTDVSTVLQASLVNAKTKQYKWFINTGLDPTQQYSDKHVLKILFDPDGAKGLTLEEMQELFNEIHRKGNIDKLKEFFQIPADSPIEIITCQGEADFIAKLKEHIQYFKPPAGKIRFSAYNGAKYDAPLLNAVSRRHGMSNIINEAELIDTKIFLEKQLNIKELTPAERTELFKLLNEYVMLRHTYTSKYLTDTTRVFLGKNTFIPSVTRHFIDNVQSVNYYMHKFGEPEKQKLLQRTLQLDTSLLLQPFNAQTYLLSEVIRDLRDMLSDLRVLQDNLSKHTITTYDFDLSESSKKLLKHLQTERLLPDNFLKNVRPNFPLKLDNVGLDINYLNTLEEVYQPMFSVKSFFDAPAVMKWFDFPNSEDVFDFLIVHTTKTARHLNNIYNSVRNPGALTEFLPEDMVLSLLKTIEIRILDLFKKANITNFTYYHLTKQTDLIGHFAKVKFLKDKLDDYIYRGRISSKDAADALRKVDPELLPVVNKMLRLIDNPRPLFMYPKDMTDKMLFTIDPIREEVKQVMEFISKESRLNMKSIEDAVTYLQEYEKIIGDTVHSAKLQKVVPLFKDMLEATEEFQRHLIRFDAINKGSFFCKVARDYVEMIDSVYSYLKLNQVLKLSPQELAAYVWHRAKSFIIFHPDDLISANYDKFDLIKDAENLQLFDAIMANKAQYEAAGLTFKQLGDGSILIYINQENLPKFLNSKIHFPRIEKDFDITNQLKSIIDHLTINMDVVYADPIKDYITKMIKAREKLVTLIPDARTSTFEKLDLPALKKLHHRLSQEVSDLLDISVLQTNNILVGTPFNHSVLGSLTTRRKFLPFVSYNPFKTMFHSIEMSHDIVASQTQFITLVRNPLLKLDKILQQFPGNTEENLKQLYEYITQSKHLKVAFLREDVKQGFRLAEIKMKDLDSLRYALENGGFIMDYNTFVKAYDVVNRNKIESPLLRELNRKLLVPIKLGYMAYNLGTIVRNMFDSGMKNIIMTRDPQIINNMFAMAKYYWNYKKDILDIYVMSKNQHITVTTATDQYFKMGKNRIPREIFELIHEFKTYGSSSGMVNEAKQFYGDTLSKLYRHIGSESSGLSEIEFKEFIYMDDIAASGFLKTKFGEHTKAYQELMEIKRDFPIYKRAYAMHQLYKKNIGKHVPEQTLTVQDLVAYQKRPVDGFIPDYHKPIFEELMRATNDLDYRETMLDKILAHPIFDKALTFHAGVEEILRLALYKYYKDMGYGIPEAASNIIRTHFDYNFKSKTQLYLEMLVPFSTFRINSIIFWTDMLSEYPQFFEGVVKGWEAATGFTDIDPEEVKRNRALQYKLYSGNITLNQQTGTTLKLHFSAIDSLRFLINPLDYAAGSLHGVFNPFPDAKGRMQGTLWRALTLEQEPYETYDQYNARRWRILWGLIPFIGPTIARLKSDPEQSWLYNAIFSPFIHKVRRYPQTPRKGMQQARVYHRKYRATLRKIRGLPLGQISYFRYRTYDRMYVLPSHRYRKGRPYPTISSRNINRTYTELHRRSISKAGRPKYRFLAFPTNKWTLPIKVGLLRNLTRHVGNIY